MRLSIQASAGALILSVVTAALLSNPAQPARAGRQVISGTSVVEDVQFSPDCKYAAFPASKAIGVWSLETGRHARYLRGHGDRVTCIAFGPQDATVVSCAGREPIIIWNAHSGEELMRIVSPDHLVHCVAFSPDGRLVGSLGEDETGLGNTTLRLWDAKTGKAIADWRVGILSGCLAFAPNSDLLASGGRRGIQVWNLDKFTLRMDIARGRAWEPNHLSFSPDSKLLAGRMQGDVTGVWERSSGNLVHRLESDRGGRVSFSMDNRYLATASENVVRLWDTRHGTEIKKLNGYRAGAFLPDGKRFGAWNIEGLFVWELKELGLAEK